ADAFHALRATLSEAVELRIATVLDPRRTRERLRLARMLLALDLAAAARRELELVAADTHDAEAKAEARRSLEELQQVPTHEEAESSLSEFGPIGRRVSPPPAP
ncbi:MAG TPA: hypothetical protein VMS88_06940, partial [Terriglobales bacterium]|nr:hypothetical protein [Terriglobales bacterium]